MSLYNQKPSQKRKHKINKLLLDQQSMLLEERIFVGPHALADPGPKAGPWPRAQAVEAAALSMSGSRPGGVGGLGTRGAGPSALDTIMRQHQAAAARHQQASAAMQGLANERREKTLKALRYIRKYQHLYQSANEASDQRNESRLLQLAERQHGERLQPVPPDHAKG
jgi:hypothetical protein